MKSITKQEIIVLMDEFIELAKEFKQGSELLLGVYKSEKQALKAA